MTCNECGGRGTIWVVIDWAQTERPCPSCTTPENAEDPVRAEAHRTLDLARRRAGQNAPEAP